MTKVRMGPKGQVVIPKAVREELDIRPGDDVIVDAVDGAARVRRSVGASGLLGLLPDGAGTAEIEAEHREEIERDERRQAALDEGRMW
ncbi:MAG: AbrB/MazE/SpoVT family DNA-binding domain-containing protein [Actinomycetota bacterium]